MKQQSQMAKFLGLNTYKITGKNWTKQICDECDGSGKWKENEQDKEINCPKCNNKNQTT